mmetsp:Transcript_49843/g.148844  ORF Transcript_49843/g.148844 Transcript_49843/m.148844 type:complete len:350 (-) Transcript_49843:1266-2315(-)
MAARRPCHREDAVAHPEPLQLPLGRRDQRKAGAQVTAHGLEELQPPPAGQGHEELHGARQPPGQGPADLVVKALRPSLVLLGPMQENLATGCRGPLHGACDAAGQGLQLGAPGGLQPHVAAQQERDDPCGCGWCRHKLAPLQGLVQLHDKLRPLILATRQRNHLLLDLLQHLHALLSLHAVPGDQPRVQEVAPRRGLRREGGEAAPRRLLRLDGLAHLPEDKLHGACHGVPRGAGPARRRVRGRHRPVLAPTHGVGRADADRGGVRAALKTATPRQLCAPATRAGGALAPAERPDVGSLAIHHAGHHWCTLRIWQRQLHHHVLLRLSHARGRGAQRVVQRQGGRRDRQA